MLELWPATVIDSDAGAPEHVSGRRPGAARAALPAGENARAPREQRLLVELGGDRGGERRAAIADVALVGRAEVGDELIVNVQALDLGLGSGGFDIVHVNLTRGLRRRGARDVHVMKLNYTSLQHAVAPVDDRGLQVPVRRPVAVLALHAQLAAVAWAFARGAPGRRLGYVQTEGGALPGGHSETVAALHERGLLAGHITAGQSFGGEEEAITTGGALHHALRKLGWDAAVCGPGPGIVGSGSSLGHGGMSALDSAHVALALGAPTLLVARMSSSDERPRHRTISHHTLTVLDLLLAPVTVALPAGVRSPVGADLRAGLRAVFGGPQAAQSSDSESARPARIARHDWRRAAVELPEFAASGLPAETMGRGPLQDPLFFAAALAGGSVLAQLLAAEEAEAPAADGRPADSLAGAVAREPAGGPGEVAVGRETARGA
jgi:hypothetical protein